MTTAQPAMPASSKALHGVRAIADTAHRWLSELALAVVVVQFFTAGLSVFQFMTEQSEGAGGGPSLHMIFGNIFLLAALLTFVAGMIAHPNRKVAWLTALLVVLAALQLFLMILGFGVSAIFGGLHAANGVALMVLLAWLVFDSRRRAAGARGSGAAPDASDTAATT